MSALTPMAPSTYTGDLDLEESLPSGEGDTRFGRGSEHSAILALAESSVAELRFLRVDENSESIHLSGRVRSFYHKQLAQEAIRPVADGRQVINRVDVCR